MKAAGRPLKYITEASDLNPYISRWCVRRLLSAGEVAMQSELEKSKATIRNMLVDRAEKEYKVLSDTYDMIDRKSQAMTAIAGVFLAAIFSVASRIGADTSLIVRIPVSVIQCILLLSVGCAVTAMYARETKDPPTGAFCDGEYRKALDGVDLPAISKYEIDAHRNCMTRWHAANLDVDRCNHVKAGWLKLSQVSLIVAAIVTTGLTMTIIFKPELMQLKAPTNVTKPQT